MLQPSKASSGGKKVDSCHLHSVTLILSLAATSTLSLLNIKIISCPLWASIHAKPQLITPRTTMHFNQPPCQEHTVLRGGNPLWIRRLKPAVKYKLGNKGRGRERLAVNCLWGFSLGRGTVFLHWEYMSAQQGWGNWRGGLRDLTLRYCGSSFLCG